MAGIQGEEVELGAETLPLPQIDGQAGLDDIGINADGGAYAESVADTAVKRNACRIPGFAEIRRVCLEIAA